MNRRSYLHCAAILVAAILWTPKIIMAADPAMAFEGDKTDWHGFDRYDFIMDDATFALTPIKATPEEGTGVKAPEKGQRRCIVVVPKQVAPGNPWSWQACYWDHMPQAEIELLKRGFHIAFITPDPGPQWDAWYTFLTEKHGLSKKPAFDGMSKGGFNAYAWATANPDKVSAIYVDNPVVSPASIAKLGDLVKNDVPLLHVCGSLDPLLGRNTLLVESIYQHLGGRISVMIKEGFAHHPHSLQDPQPIADFIEQSFHEQGLPPGPPPFFIDLKFIKSPYSPIFAGPKFTKSAYYGIENSYRYFPSEKAYITCRGPLFTDCYDRYQFNIEGLKGGGVTVIAPKTPAPGNPWVFRADFVDRNAVVDQALLAKGFHIVTGPVPFDNGPDQEQWNTTYTYFTDHGFSKKPVMEGDGAAAGEAYAWAGENPDKVSCIYGENPIMHSNLAKTPPLDNLEPLAKAGVPLLHVCGSLDPGLNDNTRVVEDRYRKFGGKIAVIIKEGEGHYPLPPEDAKPVVDFITAAIIK
jgi:pimeloyl-ACP methyl ester carboxylesterase